VEGAAGVGYAGGGVGIGVDGREGAEEETGDVGEDGGAAGGDLVAGKKAIEGGEGLVDALSVLKMTGALEEDVGEVVGAVALELGVAIAEVEGGVGDEGAALASFGGEVAAALFGEFFNLFADLLGHLFGHFADPLYGDGWSWFGAVVQRVWKLLKDDGLRMRVAGQRVWNLLKTKGRIWRGTPPPVFLRKESGNC